MKEQDEYRRVTPAPNGTAMVAGVAEADCEADSEGAPPAVASEIAQAATEIRRLASGTMLRFTNEVGRIILERFYGGSAQAWHARGAKVVSIRRLAEQLSGDGGFSASMLCRCVQIHLVLQRLGPDRTWTHLSPSHFRTVLSLPEPKQDELLEEAEDRGLSVRDVADMANRSRRPRATPAAPQPRFLRTIRRLERVATEPERWFPDLDGAADLDHAEQEKAREAVMRAIEGLENVLHRLSPKRLAARRRGASPTTSERRAAR